MSRQLVCVLGALALGPWLAGAGVASADVMEPSLVMPAAAPFAAGDRAAGAPNERSSSSLVQRVSRGGSTSGESSGLASILLGLAMAGGVAAAGTQRDFSLWTQRTRHRAALGRPRDSPGQLSLRSPAARKKERKPPVLEDC